MKLLVNVIVAILLWVPQGAGALCVQGDCTNGHGTFVLPDGRKYVGEFREGIRTGRGLMTYPDGAKYVGDWQNDKPHGKGTLILIDNFEYSGEFANGVRHGQGTLVTGDGKIYVGQWQNDIPHGQGRITYPGKEEFVGQFENGRRNGQGEVTYADGTRYKGQWADDLPNGQGVKILPDGMQYSGEFKNGLMHGTGTVVMPDGSQIKIQWQSDAHVQNAEEQSGAELLSIEAKEDWYMFQTPGEKQARQSREPIRPAGHMAVSSQGLFAAAEATPPQEIVAPDGTAEQILPQASEMKQVAVEAQAQTEVANEIRRAQVEEVASEVAEASRRQEVATPVETAEQILPLASEKEQVATEEQTQTEAVNEIQIAVTEEMVPEAALPAKKEQASGHQEGYALYSETTNGVKYASVATGANIRSDAALTSEVLRSVPPGYPVAVLERQTDWALVEDFRQRKGWVFAPLLTEPGTVIIKVYKGNLRSGPGLTDDIIVQLDHGTVMSVVETRGDWLMVSDSENVTGWLHRKVIWP
jgi:SH3-like domain-containing protein